MTNPKPKCQGCGGQVTPAYDLNKKALKKFFTCRACAATGKTQYWEFPFDYAKLFEKGYVWMENHPDYPKGFLDTDMSRLSTNLQAASKWNPDAGGKASILLHGITGAGKTRTAWVVFNRLWRDGFPDQAVWLPMRKLEGAIEKGFENQKHGQVLEFLCTVPLLCLDDLGKERLTNRFESDLFAILDERTSNLRTTIITTNYNGQTLLERFNNKETGEAFLRRVREYFHPVHS